MKTCFFVLALATVPALSMGCSGGVDDPEETGDGDDTCSDEETEIPTSEGGAGGAPTASCEMPGEPTVMIEIAGNYTDQFGSDVEITSSTWSFGFEPFTLSIVDNDDNYAVARNSAMDAFNPCAWSAFHWHEGDDGLYYCQSAFSATSECAAEQAAAPDASDLETGCSGFPWSQLTPN